jgi:hypothetical protein
VRNSASEVSWKGVRMVPPRTAMVRLFQLPGFLLVAMRSLWRGCGEGVKLIKVAADKRISQE